LYIIDKHAPADLPAVNFGIAGYWSELLGVLYRYCDLKLVIPHFALSTRAPDRLRFLLKRFPNVLTDTSFGQDEFLLVGPIRVGQSAKLRELVSAYSERFLFATDLVLTDAAHKTPQWMADRVEHYRSMLTAGRYWSKVFQSEHFAVWLCRSRRAFDQVCQRRYVERRFIAGVTLSRNLRRSPGRKVA
jgi:hypothetical protein